MQDDGVPFSEGMEGLTRELATGFHESEKLQAAIRARLQKLGFVLPEVGEWVRKGKASTLIGERR